MDRTGHEVQNRSQALWDKTIPVTIIAIYDLGPGYSERYTIVTSSPKTAHEKMTSGYRALVTGERAEHDMPQPHWISVGQIFPKQQYGVKTTYESLPEDVKKYLNVRKIFPENSQQTNPNLSSMFSPQDVKDLADETLEYLCKEYPLERNTQMRASFEIFCAEIISRSYNEAYKRTQK
jgi:hypothetical protein